MQEKQLTLEQNLCAARIFLNTFNLILEEKLDVNENTILKIFDKENNEVGKLWINNDRVFMESNYNNCTLQANYNLTCMISFIDEEANNASFSQWASQINFLFKGNNLELTGEFFMSNFIDSQFGISCNCHPLLKIKTPNQEIITLNILREGCFLKLEKKTDNYNETVEIRPWDNLGECIIHDTKIGKYDQKNGYYPYRKYAGIFNAGEQKEVNDKLHLFLTENENGNCLNYQNDFIIKEGERNSSERVIQKGLLMQKLDPDMIKKIIELKNTLQINNLSLLDNLIGVCYDNCKEEEIYALLGIKRVKFDYQNGLDSLVDSYYEFGKSNKFSFLEPQKKLQKKIKK